MFPTQAKLNPGSCLILGVPGGVAPVWSWADKSPCLANSASITTWGQKHWRKYGEVTWIGLLRIHFSSTCPANYRPCLRWSVGTGHIRKNHENPTTCDKEWMITSDIHLSCILGSPNCDRSNSNSTVTGEIDHTMQRRLLKWTQNSQTAHVACANPKICIKRYLDSFLWRLIKHRFNIAVSIFLPYTCVAGGLLEGLSDAWCKAQEPYKLYTVQRSSERTKRTAELDRGTTNWANPSTTTSQVISCASCEFACTWKWLRQNCNLQIGPIGHQLTLRSILCTPSLSPSDSAYDSNCNRSHLFRAKSYRTMVAELWVSPYQRGETCRHMLESSYADSLISMNSNSRSKSVWIVSLGVWDAALLIILPWSTASTPSSTDLFVAVAQDCGRNLKGTHSQIRCEGKFQHHDRSWNEIHLQQSAWLSIHQDHVTLPQTSCWYLHNRNANLTQNWINMEFLLVSTYT